MNSPITSHPADKSPDELDQKIGQELVKLLGLKRKRASKRFFTIYGDKTEMGLTRSIRRIFLETKL